MTFWTREMILLADSGEVEMGATGASDAYSVVADWLEERGCRQAARCFRGGRDYAPWRTLLRALAREAPELRPDYLLMTLLNAQVKGAEAIMAEPYASYGVNLASYLNRPLPDLPDDD